MSDNTNYSEYQESLKDPEWNIARHKIFKRDKYQCLNCYNDDFLINNKIKKKYQIQEGQILEVKECVNVLKMFNPGDNRFDRYLYQVIFYEQEGNKPLKSEILSHVFLDTTELKSFKGLEIFHLNIRGFFENTKTLEERIIFRIINPNLIDSKRLFYIRKLRLHHKYYIKGKKPWDYPDEALMTLCDSCHERFHQNNSVPIKNLIGSVIGFVPKGIDNTT